MIHVCSLAHAHDVARALKPSRVVSILDPGDAFPAFAEAGEAQHLRLELYDVGQDMEGAPSAAHIDALLEFVRAWDGAGALLIHCQAGISRSSAAAFIAACARNVRTPEIVIARALREAAPMASPNRLMVRMADAALGRGGRMFDAVFAIGRGEGWSGDGAVPYALASHFSENF